ncbi:uncharacterized [Tachysurus ichikawai]
MGDYEAVELKGEMSLRREPWDILRAIVEGNKRLGASWSPGYGAAAMTGPLSGLTARIKEVAPESGKPKQVTGI